MKNKRQNAIISIITEKKIKTHNGIITELEKRGFDVTQATVSRDIKELSLEKKEHGYYVVPEAQKQRHQAKAFSVSICDIDFSGNLIVIKTTPGAASIIASSVDQIIRDKILGTIAGDDTIFIAIKENGNASEIKEKLIEVFDL